MSVSQTGTLHTGVARTVEPARNSSSVMPSGMPRNSNGASEGRLRSSAVLRFGDVVDEDTAPAAESACTAGAAMPRQTESSSGANAPRH